MQTLDDLEAVLAPARRPAARRGALLHVRGSGHQQAAGDPHGPALVPGAALPPRRQRPASGPAARWPRAPRDGAGAAVARASPSSGTRSIRRIASSLVVVNFDMPYTISGVAERHYYGTGVIVDAERGFVVVDRNTVPESMGDVQITFGGNLEVPGRVAYIHPTHNLALVAYDPKLIGDTPVRAARLQHEAAAARRRRAGRRPARRLQADLPDDRGRLRGGRAVPAVADDPVSRDEPGDSRSRQRARRHRRRDPRSARATSSRCGRASPSRAAASPPRRTAASRRSWCANWSISPASSASCARSKWSGARSRWRMPASSACRTTGRGACRTTIRSGPRR